MAGILAKSAYGAAKFATKYVIVPIVYSAFIGYLLKEAADRIRHDEHHESPVDPELQPAR